jgi:hypothetical protein
VNSCLQGEIWDLCVWRSIYLTIVSPDSLSGEVAVWDIRLAEPLKMFQAHQRNANSLAALAVHEHAPVFAT